MRWVTLVVRVVVAGALCCAAGAAGAADVALRARGLGVPFEGTPGPGNAITDVPGVEVGQVTHVSGDGKLKIGTGPVRTGVTVVLPRGRPGADSVYGGFFDLNGNGELTGQAYLQDFGVVIGPISISNTNAIGQVYAGIRQWTREVQARRDAGGADLGRAAEQHWRVYLQPSDAIAAIEAGADWAGGRRQCWRGHWHGVLRLQGRHRDRVAQGVDRGFGLGGGRARSMQHGG